MIKNKTYQELAERILQLESEQDKYLQAEKSLRESEVKYQTVFERSKDAILIIKNRSFVDCNQATVEMLGYKNKEDFLRTHPSELSPTFQPDGKESYSKAQQMMDLAVKYGSHRFEWDHLTNGGRIIPVEVLLTTISAAKDDEVIQTIWRDITKQRKAQKTIETSARRFHDLVQQSPAIIELYDRNGLQLEVNKAYEELWGFDAATTVGSFNVLKSAEVIETGLIHYIEKAYNGETVTLPEYRFNPTGKTEAKSKGRARWLNTKIYPLFTDGGEVDNIVITHEDVTERKNAEEELKHSEERFRSLVETTSDWIWEVNIENQYTYVSPKITDVLGYQVDEILGKTPFDLMSSSQKENVEKAFHAIQEQAVPFSGLENINLHKDGHPVTLETSGVPFFNEDNELLGYRGIDRDISQRKQSEEALLLTESVFTNTIEGIAITDRHGRIERVNQAFTDITGYAKEEAIGQNPRILKSDRHDNEFYQTMWKDLFRHGQWSGEIWNRRKDGSAYPEWLSISSIHDEHGEITNFISLFHDISEKKVQEERLQFLAFHDPLTKLPNRKLLYDRARVSLLNAKRMGSKMALLYMDIDNFKNINDSYGHPFGDKFLCRVKERIESICRTSDTFARYGGDEFVVVLNHIQHKREVVRFAERIIDLFTQPISISGEELYSSVSIGMAIFPEDGTDIVTLEKNADMALYEAKRSGKWRASFVNEGLKDSMERGRVLENELRGAIKDFSSFQIFYQPKVNSKNNTIHGVEALLRWTVNGAPVSPVEFIPIAETTNLIIPLGKWLMQKAMTEMQLVHEQEGHEDLTLSINLSSKQFNDETLFVTIQDTLKSTGFNQTKLCFEITESIPMQDESKAIGIMEKLESMGIRLSMDDFGTGYSSLSVLKKFPLRELKIDRSFIKDIPRDKNDMAISRAIIQMAKMLKFDVVAEGVETEEQLKYLEDNDCHLIQGFYYYKPMNYVDLLTTLHINPSLLDS